MTKLTYPVLFASLALAYGHALAVDTSVPKAEDYEAVPESEMPKQPKDDQTGKLKPKFPVKIDTQDSEVKEMLEEYLPLITQQQEEELDKEQVGFLAEEAPDNVKTMLRTKGYFNSNVNIQDHGESYTVNVTPGPRTKVDNVSVAILGDVLNDDNLAEYYQNAMENWQQPVGENFDQDGLDKILDLQQALEQNGHYSGASVQADFDQLQGDRVPVKINVTEVKRHKLETGIRYDSEYGIGGRIAYDYYNLFNKGYIGSIVWDMDKYETTLAAGISQPRNNRGNYWTSHVSYNRSTTQNLEKRALSSGIWYVRDRNNIDARFGLEFITEDRKVPDTSYDLGRSHATMLTASWKRQSIETELHPQNGYYLDGKIGLTLGKFLSSTQMARATARAGYFFTPENKKIGTFIVRGQAGYVYAREGEEVPSSLMFRTGGATSVRGYELDSIGLAGPNGSVLPQRALVVGSLEYQFPVTKSFSGAIFHDVGDAASNFKHMTLKHGTGLGVRWFSPVAPFSFDIAYGHHDKKIRWHISLGTRF